MGIWQAEKKEYALSKSASGTYAIQTRYIYRYLSDWFSTGQLYAEKYQEFWVILCEEAVVVQSWKNCRQEMVYEKMVWLAE